MSELAAELEVVLPVSFFERANNAHYNSLVVIDADGGNRGLYRKTHIPRRPGLPGEVLLQPRRHRLSRPLRPATPRSARRSAGTSGSGRAPAPWPWGAEILFYPTAIGSEPQDPTLVSKDHWQRTMQGHAAANMVPLVASNRIETEQSDGGDLTFYGASFIADETGAKVAEASGDKQEVITASFDLEAIRAARASWGLFRDRRPDLYGPLLTLDGGPAGKVQSSGTPPLARRPAGPGSPGRSPGSSRRPGRRAPAAPVRRSTGPP